MRLLAVCVAVLCWMMATTTATTTEDKCIFQRISRLSSAGSHSLQADLEERAIVYSLLGKVLVADKKRIVVPIEIHKSLLEHLIVKTINQGLQLVNLSRILNKGEYDSCKTSHVYVPEELRFQLHNLYLKYKENKESSVSNQFLKFDSILSETIVQPSARNLIDDILKRLPTENTTYDIYEVLKSNSTQTIPYDAFEPGLINYDGYNNQTYDVDKIRDEMKKDSYWCFKHGELIFSQANWERALLKFLKNSESIGQILDVISNGKFGPLEKRFLKKFKIGKKFAEFCRKSKLGKNAIYSANYSRAYLAKSEPRTRFEKWEIEIPVFDKTLVYDAFKVLKVSKSESVKNEIIGLSNRASYLHISNDALLRTDCLKVSDGNIDYLCPHTFQVEFNSDSECLSEFSKRSNGFRVCSVNKQSLKNEKCSEMCFMRGEGGNCSLVCNYWPVPLPLEEDKIHFKTD